MYREVTKALCQRRGEGRYHMMRIVIGGERCEGKGGVYLVQHLSILSIQINVLLVLVNK